MPKGGARLGSGRKPIAAWERDITGNPGHRGRMLPGPGGGEAVVVAPLAVFGPSEDLASEERAVWQQLAPHAFKARTLTRATELAFQLLCRNIVLERLYASSVADKGGANHRGLIQRVDAELAAFSLRPFGKPIFEAEPVTAHPLDRFLNRQKA